MILNLTTSFSTELKINLLAFTLLAKWTNRNIQQKWRILMSTSRKASRRIKQSRKRLKLIWTTKKCSRSSASSTTPRLRSSNPKTKSRIVCTTWEQKIAGILHRQNQLWTHVPNNLIIKTLLIWCTKTKKTIGKEKVSKKSTHRIYWTT